MRVGGYEVLFEIGRGGMGAVYLARREDGAKLALKLLSQESPEGLDRFERERRLLSSLGEEDGFVPLLDSGAEAGRPFIVMPFLKGATLRERLRRGPLPVEEARALVERLARALGRAHARGIVHRDLKPANVLFDGRGRAFVADLGLAKHFRHDLPGASQSAALTDAGASAGTYGYMAPEQIDDARTVGPPADVFSLGAILYECLAGERPFGGQGLIGYLKKLECREMTPLLEVRPEVGPALASTVERALAHAPGERFPDGGALALALSEHGRKPGRRRALIVSSLIIFIFIIATAGAAAAFVFRDASEPAKPAPVGLSASELVSRARARIDRKEYDAAIADCARAIELDPKNAKAWASRGEARNQKGDHEGGIADCTRAIALDARLVLAWSTRGTARVLAHELDGAIADLSRALELDPRLAVAWENRATARYENGDPEGALADVSRAIELVPGDAAACCARGYIRSDLGDTEGALADATRAVDLNPRYARARKLRAVLRYKKRELDGALEDLERLLELGPSERDAAQARGLLLELKKDKARAFAQRAFDQ
ncbi:protein kinase, partial [bacterium]|nr:protein kinase [bacterium]